MAVAHDSFDYTPTGHPGIAGKAQTSAHGSSRIAWEGAMS